MANDKEVLRAMHKAKQKEREAKRSQGSPEPEQPEPLTELNETLMALTAELKNVRLEMRLLGESIARSAAMNPGPR